MCVHLHETVHNDATNPLSSSGVHGARGVSTAIRHVCRPLELGHDVLRAPRMQATILVSNVHSSSVLSLDRADRSHMNRQSSWHLVM